MIFRQLIRFLFVGGIGFLIDGGLLFLQIWLGINPYLARFVSFPIAVVATWRLNRFWTFPQADRASPSLQFNRYLAVQVVGALCNYIAYASVLAANDETTGAAALGFALGSAIGLIVNFLGARIIVFKPQS